MENNPILDNGMSMPYVSVFDSKGQPIIDPLTEVPIGMLVVNFQYEYQEEKEDECEITIETDNPNIIDLPALKANMPIRVQWGHIFPDKSSKSGPVRTVVIRDIDGNYGDRGVRYTFKCTDAFAVTKNMPASIKEEMFATWVKNNVQDKFFIEVVDFNAQHKIFKKPIENPADNARQRNK